MGNVFSSSQQSKECKGSVLICLLRLLRTSSLIRSTSLLFGHSFMYAMSITYYRHNLTKYFLNFQDGALKFSWNSNDAITRMCMSYFTAYYNKSLNVTHLSE
jgi:hypothetical protein